LIRLWINSSRVRMSRDSAISGLFPDCVVPGCFGGQRFGLELVVELPQRLMFMNSFSRSRAAYSRSRSEWLVAPSFAPSCRWAFEGAGPRAATVVEHWRMPPWGELVSSVVCGQSMASGDCAPIVLMALHLDVASLMINGLLYWDHQCYGRGF